MPKRYGKRERWRRKLFNSPRQQALREFTKAMFNPSFRRVFHSWVRCQREPIEIRSELCGYCLDRPDPI
jgi:hypothetical protein